MLESLILILGGIGGAVFTFLLQKAGCSAVVASCIVGLIGALIGHFTLSTHLPLIVFCGSFVGMTSLTLGSIPLMILGGALCGLVYKISLNVFAGYGGRLGTIAFISTVISVYLFSALKQVVKYKSKS